MKHPFLFLLVMATGAAGCGGAGTGTAVDFEPTPAYEHASTSAQPPGTSSTAPSTGAEQANPGTQAPNPDPNQPNTPAGSGASVVDVCESLCADAPGNCMGTCFDDCGKLVSLPQCAAHATALFACAQHAGFECNDNGEIRLPENACDAEASTFGACIRASQPPQTSEVGPGSGLAPPSGGPPPTPQ